MTPAPLTPAPARPDRVWVVIPVLNELENMEPLFADLGPRAQELHLHVVLVDDGSTDGTAELAREQAQANGIPLTVVTHEVNQGLGAAVQSGLLKALAMAESEDDAVVTLEGDNTADLDDLSTMLDYFARGSDLVMASFYAPGGKTLGVDAWRIWTSKIVNFLFHALGGLREFHQITPLYRAYRVGTLRRTAERYGGALVRESGFVVNAELLIKMRDVGARIVEVPTTIDWNQRRGESKLPLRATIIAYVKFLTRLAAGRMQAPALPPPLPSAAPGQVGGAATPPQRESQ
jgi:dolichol-phosphate mannosyltransferase